MSNKWTRLQNPPPPLFTGKREQDFQKQIVMELTERVIGTQIAYYPLDIEHSNYHKLYGECQEKIYLPPIQIYCLIDQKDFETVTDQYGVDRIQNVTFHLHSRRLTEDKDLQVQEGDIIQYNDQFYEIFEINDAQLVYGQINYKAEIAVKARKVREGFFTP